MSPRLQAIRHLLSLTKLVPILLLSAFAITFGSASTHAQDTWQINPHHSFALLSLGSGANAVQIGLARVSGEVVFESAESDDPTVSFKTVSENSKQSAYAELQFKSKRCEVRADGKLVVTGDLSVTRVERSVTAEPNEGYAGQQYSDPLARTVTREITLVFSNPRQRDSKTGVMQLSGTSSVVREEFSQLLDAITLDDWATQLVNDERCVNPATIGEDYSGPECTGTVIAAVSNTVAPTGSGEDFSGFKPAANPDPERGSIALNLQLKSISAATTRSSTTNDGDNQNP